MGFISEVNQRFNDDSDARTTPGQAGRRAAARGGWWYHIARLGPEWFPNPNPKISKGQGAATVTCGAGGRGREEAKTQQPPGGPPKKPPRSTNTTGRRGNPRPPENSETQTDHTTQLPVEPPSAPPARKGKGARRRGGPQRGQGAPPVRGHVGAVTHNRAHVSVRAKVNASPERRSPGQDPQHLAERRTGDFEGMRAVVAQGSVNGDVRRHRRTQILRKEQRLTGDRPGLEVRAENRARRAPSDQPHRATGSRSAPAGSSIAARGGSASSRRAAGTAAAVRAPATVGSRSAGSAGSRGNATAAVPSVATAAGPTPAEVVSGVLRATRGRDQQSDTDTPKDAAPVNKHHARITRERRRVGIGFGARGPAPMGRGLMPRATRATSRGGVAAGLNDVTIGSLGTHSSYAPFTVQSGNMRAAR